MGALGWMGGDGVSVHACPRMQQRKELMPMLEKRSLGIQCVFSYKSVPWSTWPRAFSNPFAADNASYSSQPQGQESQPHESLPF